jgi:serine phosphatase RsbU (regulator of sigma subunit)
MSEDGDDAAGEGLRRPAAASSLPGGLSALAGDDEWLAGGGLPAGGQAGDDLLVVPLESERPGQTAVLAFADKEAGSFSESDRLLAATLAAHAGSSLRNTLSFQHEHEIAETFQNALRMEPWPMAGLDVGVCYNPATDAARVGGDFYDLVSLGPGRLMVAVGDVCGKGLPAAAQTAVARYMLRAYAAEGSPGEALSRLNAAMIDQDDTQPFVTLVVAYVDVGRRMFEYAVAGHPRPLVQTADGQFAVPRDGSFPLGVIRGAVYATNRVVLPEASTVLLFTDGIVDARHERELFGEGRLLDAVGARLDRPAAELAEELVALVRDFAGGSLEDDGVTVVLKLS